MSSPAGDPLVLSEAAAAGPRAAGPAVTGPRERRVCFNLRVIVDGSYWVGRRAHHFDQRCS